MSFLSTTGDAATGADAPPLLLVFETKPGKAVVVDRQAGRPMYTAGASVDWVSQHPAHREILFPSGTVLHSCDPSTRPHAALSAEQAFVFEPRYEEPPVVLRPRDFGDV